MAEDAINVQPATAPSGAPGSPVPIKIFSMIDGRLQLVDAQAIVNVDTLGRPFTFLSEETGQRIAQSNEVIANLLAILAGQMQPY